MFWNAACKQSRLSYSFTSIYVLVFFFILHSLADHTWLLKSFEQRNWIIPYTHCNAGFDFSDRSETQYESRSCLLKKTLTFIYYFFVTSDLFHSFLFSLVNLLTVSVWLSCFFLFVLLAWFRLLLCFFPTTSIFGGPLYCFCYSLRFFLFIFVDCRCNP